MRGGKCVYANVIVDIVHENVAHTFTYRIPDQISVEPGQRVSVPFGYQQKEGVVLSLAETTGLPPESSRIWLNWRWKWLRRITALWLKPSA